MSESQFLVISLIASFILLIPLFIVLNYYRVTKIIDYLLFAGIFITFIIFGIIDILISRYSHLILYQLRHIFMNMGYLLILWHAQRVKNQNLNTVAFVFGIFWFLQISFLILFWKVIEQPEFISFSGIQIHHSVVLTASYPIGAGVYINDFLFYSTEFRLFSDAFVLYCLASVWWAYYKIDLAITDTRTVLARRLWLIAISTFLLFVGPNVLSLNHLTMPVELLLITITILLGASLFLPEALMISHNQFSNIYQLQSTINKVKREKYHRIYSGTLLINYLDRLQQDFLEKDRIIQRQSDLLFESQKHEAMSRLAGGIAHDFNNFLMGISGYTELIYAEIDNTDNTKIYFNEISDIIVRASSVLKQILLYSKNQVIDTVTFDINLQIESMKNLISILNSKNTVIKYELDQSDSYYIQFDITQFHQIMMNFISNSLDTLDSNGVIVIKTEYLSEIENNFRFNTNSQNSKFGYIKMQIIDNGLGIPKQNLSKVFDPYFTTKNKGAGLGLSIVKTIVNQNNGIVTCESEENQGTTFSVILPVQKLTVVDDTQEIEKEYKDHFEDKTILLVEDDNKILSLISNALNKFGCEVLEASNGKEAIDVEVNYPNKIHVVISDIKMPGMSGITLCKQLLISRPDLKIIFISGYTEEKVDPRIFKSKFSYLQKPFNLSDLLYEIKDGEIQ